jgi:hypothetical protein
MEHGIAEDQIELGVLERELLKVDTATERQVIRTSPSVVRVEDRYSLLRDVRAHDVQVRIPAAQPTREELAAASHLEGASSNAHRRDTPEASLEHRGDVQALQVPEVSLAIPVLPSLGVPV